MANNLEGFKHRRSSQMTNLSELTLQTTRLILSKSTVTRAMCSYRINNRTISLMSVPKTMLSLISNKLIMMIKGCLK